MRSSLRNIWAQDDETLEREIWKLPCEDMFCTARGPAMRSSLAGKRVK